MREDATGLLDEVQKLGLVYLFQSSSPKAVVLSLDEFKRILEAIEDSQDVVYAEKVLSDKKTKFLPLDSFWKKYNLAK